MKFVLKYSTKDGLTFSQTVYDRSVKAALNAILKRRARLNQKDIICIEIFS